MRIVFCGVGALGSNAVLACRNLAASFALVDFDRVESKNCLSQAFVNQSVGKNKAEALKLQLANFYGVKTESFGVRLTEANVRALCGAADLVVDTFDNARSRRILSDFARSADKPLLHGAISGDGTFGLVRWDPRFVADEESVEGRATCEDGAHLPLVSLIAATLARAVQSFVSEGRTWDAMVSLSGVNTTL